MQAGRSSRPPLRSRDRALLHRSAQSPFDLLCEYQTHRLGTERPQRRECLADIAGGPTAGKATTAALREVPDELHGGAAHAVADERRGFRPRLDVQTGVMEPESDVEEARAGDQVGRSELIALTAQQARPHECGDEPRRPIPQALAELRLAQHERRLLGPRLTQMFPDAQPLLEGQPAMRRLTQGVADGAQVQAAVLQLGNESQPLEVFVPVERDAALARGPWKGAHPLVVSHRPAGHARRRGQLVDRVDPRVGAIVLASSASVTVTAMPAFDFHVVISNRYSFNCQG
jgi:hypothetical protein